MGETITLAQHLVDLKAADIPAAIWEETKILLFDYLGVALGGTRTESGKIVAQFAREQGGKREATVIGFGYRVPPASAAFSNAIISHSIELDDVDSLAYFHFSPPDLFCSPGGCRKSACLGKGTARRSGGRMRPHGPIELGHESCSQRQRLPHHVSVWCVRRRSGLGQASPVEQG